jgi:tetratricopeptide (TPR) repeat protein
MVLGALGCLHFHLTARRLAEQGASARKVSAFHVGAALACAVACLSNAVAAVIPLLITAWDLLMLRPLRSRSIISGTSALWLIGAATIAIKKLGNSTDPNVQELGVFTVERLMVVLNVYWLNLHTLFWPSGLTVDYWNVAPASFAEPGVMLGAAALLATCLALWRFRRQKRLLFGLLWFGLALAPTAQIMPHHLDRADRFLYLPLVGLVVAGAFCLRALGNALPRRGGAIAVTAAGTLCLLLVARRAAVQVQTWRDSIAVWQHCVDVIPTNAFAHRCLAECLSDDGRFPEAFSHYLESLRIDPNNPETLDNLANRLSTCRQHEFRDYPQAIRLATEACRLTEGKEPSLVRTLAVAHMNYATALKGEARFEPAIENYGKAIETDPEYEVPLFNLATLLAGCPDERFRRPDEAVELAVRACSLRGDPEPVQWAILADVYARTGRLKEAAATTEKAVRKAQAGGDQEMARQLQIRLQGYRDQIRAQSAGPPSSPSE